MSLTSTERKGKEKFSSNLQLNTKSVKLFLSFKACVADKRKARSASEVRDLRTKYVPRATSDETEKNDCEIENLLPYKAKRISMFQSF